MKKSILLIAFFIIHALDFQAQTSKNAVTHSYSIDPVTLTIGYGITIDVGAFIKDSTYSLIFDVSKAVGSNSSGNYVAKGDSLTFFLKDGNTITIYSSYNVSGSVSRIVHNYQSKDGTNGTLVAYILKIDKIRYNITKAQLNSLMASKVKAMRLYVHSHQGRFSIRHKIELKRRKVMQTLAHRIVGKQNP